MPTEIKEKHFLAYACEEKSAIDELRRAIRFIVSTDTVDRDNEIVMVDAVANAIKAFAKNPVCLACHRHSLDNGMPPVVGSWDTESFKAMAHSSEMDLIFATTELGETWWNLYKNRHVRAISIGFRVLDGAEEVRDSVRIFIITKIELYEISCVPVPANPQALSKLKEVGILREEDIKAFQPLATIEKILTDHLGTMEKHIKEELKEELEDQFDRLKLILIDKDNPNGCGGDPFGDPDIPPVEEIKSEDVLSVLQKVVNENSNGENKP